MSALARRRLAPVFATLVATSFAMAAPPLAHHPGQLPPLVPDGTFPRCALDELVAAGYPDPLHRYQWPGYVPMVDGGGETYGPFSLARGTAVLPREGLDLQSGQIRYRRLHLAYHPDYDHAAMLPWVELVDWAQRQVPPLLGLERTDTLRLRNPDDLDHYRDLTGAEYTRLYVSQDTLFVNQPVPILLARTLAPHAAFGLVTEWLLSDLPGSDALPRWFVQGLVEYIAEDGQHLCNYMAQFRPHGEILLGSDAVESILANPPDPDPERDRQMYRQACYSAFLMVWELVENRGGLAKMRTLLARMAGGENLDQACEAVYGSDLVTLAGDLDATRRPEPVGDGIESRQPHRAPVND